MMNLRRFDRQGLRQRLENLDPSQRAQFAIDVARRLLPGYQRFHDETGQGDPSALARALDTAQTHLPNPGTAVGDLKLLADRCEALVPTEDGPWTDLSGPAQNAAAAAAYALRSVLSGSVDDAVWAAVQGYEAADLAASTNLDVDFNEPGVEERVLRQDVVQRELSAQEGLIRRLEQDQD